MTSVTCPKKWRCTRRWTTLPLCQHIASIPRPSPPRPANRHTVREQLSLTSWNIHASPFKRVERSQLILDRILGPKSSDIIFLQEVASDVRQSVLDDPRVRSRFLTSDAENDIDFKGVPFATMTLLSNERFASPLLAEKKDGSDGKGEGEGDSKMMLHSAFRMTLPSRYERDALCVNFYDPATPGNVLRLLNVHLDSLDSCFRRAFQVYLLDRLLREGGCSGGVIAGDFNAIDPNDRTLVEKHGLVDAWVKLYGRTTGHDGATWGVGVELENGLKPSRLDKVVMLGLEPVDIEVLQPGHINAGTPWSDHCGLRCTFRV
ncbi:Endonuclease/exonuclease/phosphatase [Lactarius tabidus]